MPLHHSSSPAPSTAADPTDAAMVALLARPLPRDHFPVQPSQPEMVFEILSEELLLDGNSKQNLATFCQT